MTENVYQAVHHLIIAVATRYIIASMAIGTRKPVPAGRCVRMAIASVPDVWEADARVDKLRALSGYLSKL